MDSESDENYDFEKIAKVLIRALDKHIFLPIPRLKLRAYVYGRLSRKDKFLWIHINDTLKTLMSPNEIGEFIVPVPGHNGWVTIPDYIYKNEVRKEHEDLLFKKVDVYEKWQTNSNEIGTHLELVMCNAFSQCGYDTHWNESRSWTDKYGVKEKIQIDVTAENGHKFIIETKNHLSDVFHSPRGELETQLNRLFTLSLRNGFIPIFVAPFIHESFYGFSRKYNGLALSWTAPLPLDNKLSLYI